LPDRQQLDIEHQRRVGRNRSIGAALAMADQRQVCGRAPWPVGTSSGNEAP